MAGGSSKSNAPKARKRVEAESSSSSTLVRAKNGSAFAKCEECNKNVPVVLISMHSCSLDAKIKMNLEAQVVEKSNEVKKSVKRKKPTSTSTEPKSKRLRKAAKDNSNKPKRPPTAFFIFMDDFRKECKEANPGSKGGKEVAKEGGEKWKNMSDEEKKPYLEKAAELKAEYGKALESNNDAENEDDGSSENEDAADKEDDVEKVDEGLEKEDANEKEDVAEKEEQQEEEVLDDY